MKIAFLGINPMGKRVYDWLCEQGENVLCLIAEKKELDVIPQLQPDILISAGFRHKIPKEILDIPAHGAINFHKSLLPFNRGANPVFWTLFEETPCGVSIHYMTEQLDTGDLIAQKEVIVEFSETAGDLYQRLEDEQVDLFKSIWPDLKTNRIQVVKQAGTGSYHRIDDFRKLRKIDPNQTMRAIDWISFLKAMTFPPFKNAYIEKDNKKYRIEIAITEEKETPSAKVPYLRQYE